MPTDPGPCPCWANTHALGHDGHCCFLHDDRATGQTGGAWRADEDICHIPRTPTTTPTPPKAATP